jgi:hypothetical protein
MHGLVVQKWQINSSWKIQEHSQNINDLVIYYGTIGYFKVLYQLCV